MGRRQTASIGLTVISVFFGILLCFASWNVSAQNTPVNDGWTANSSVGFASSGRQTNSGGAFQAPRTNQAVRVASAGGFQNYIVPKQNVPTAIPETPPAQIDFDAAPSAAPARIVATPTLNPNPNAATAINQIQTGTQPANPASNAVQNVVPVQPSVQNTAPNFATAPSGSLLPKPTSTRPAVIVPPTGNRPNNLFPTSTAPIAQAAPVAPAPVIQAAPIAQGALAVAPTVPAPTAQTALIPLLPESPLAVDTEMAQQPIQIAENNTPLTDLNNNRSFAENTVSSGSAPALLEAAAPQTAPQAAPQTVPIQTAMAQADPAVEPSQDVPQADSAAELLGTIPEAPSDISAVPSAQNSQIQSVEQPTPTVETQSAPQITPPSVAPTVTQNTPQAEQAPPAAVSQAPLPTSGVLTGDELPTAPSAPGIVPPPDGFSMTQEEEKLLNEFLFRWEDFGRHIKRVACDVQVMEQDGGLFLQNNKTEQKRPISHTYGSFRFIAPNKLLYHVAGEFIYQPGASSDEPFKKECKKGSGELKFVCDGKSWAEYDFNKRVMNVYPIPEDQWNQDLSMDGPFPLFFIANARNLKNRFYMRIITPASYRESQVWIEAFPRLSADAGSFQRIIIILNLADLQPSYMRKFHVNGKSYSELWFSKIEINKGFWDIDAKVDFGWKKEVKDETFAITPADTPK